MSCRFYNDIPTFHIDIDIVMHQAAVLYNESSHPTPHSSHQNPRQDLGHAGLTSRLFFHVAPPAIQLSHTLHRRSIQWMTTRLQYSYLLPPWKVSQRRSMPKVEKTHNLYWHNYTMHSFDMRTFKLFIPRLQDSLKGRIQGWIVYVKIDANDEHTMFTISSNYSSSLIVKTGGLRIMPIPTHLNPYGTSSVRPNFFEVACKGMHHQNLMDFP